MTDISSSRPRPILPGLARLYLPLDTTVETVVRVVAGISAKGRPHAGSGSPRVKAAAACA